VREEDEREIVDDPDTLVRSANVAFSDDILGRLDHRLHGLKSSGRPPGIAGVYTMNRQDVHPVVGPCNVDRFWMASGFSGHGFKLAPAIGSMVARALGGDDLGFDTGVPMSVLSVDRDPIGVDAKNVLA
jgi:glycine/D-amino acid oxidase-like deaminating enzyme